jgi:amino acid transporter
MEAAAAATPAKKHVSTWQAAFIGVGAMVGAGIFSLLGSAGAVAGAAVWISFLLAGGVAALQGYSFAKLGAKFPTGGGMLEYVNQGYGRGHIADVTAWLLFEVNAIITAMVAVSFGSYLGSAVGNTSLVATKLFAVAIVLVMTFLNVAGSTFVARVQSAIVFVVVGILALFSVVTIANFDPTLLAPANYPGVQDIVASIALTFFAFLGFGIVTFTAKDLENPARQLPRAIAIAIGIATVVYVAVSLGVFGTLTVPQVIEAGPTAIAVAAQPSLGQLGFWLMTVTALFSTAGATNAGLYPAPGISEELANNGQFPPVMGRKIAGRAHVGLVAASALTILMALFFNLNAIASIGSAVALAIFAMITIGHLRIRSRTGANLILLLLALVTSAVSLITFVFTSFLKEPASIVTLILIFVVSVILDLWWSSVRSRQAKAATT